MSAPSTAVKKVPAKKNVVFEITDGEVTFGAQQSGNSNTLRVWIGGHVRQLFGTDIGELRKALARGVANFAVGTKLSGSATPGAGFLTIHRTYGDATIRLSDEQLLEIQQMLEVANTAVKAACQRIVDNGENYKRHIVILQEETLIDIDEVDALLAALRADV